MEELAEATTKAIFKRRPKLEEDLVRFSAGP